MMHATSHLGHERCRPRRREPARGGGQVIVFDGAPGKEADARIKRVLTNNPMLGIFRHADAGYEVAQQCADELGVKIPMRG